MPSSKRKPARRKAADMNDTTELELPDSSPSRPSAKKRKVNGARANSSRKSVTPDLPPQDVEDSGEESEAVSQSDLIDSVVSYLQVSKEPVAATIEYANEKEQPENVQKVSAYAKIAGRDWTYFVREQVVNIGRPPDGGKDMNGMPAGVSSPIADMKEVMPVHIDLGPSKIVSRHHASVFYDSEYPDGGGWHVRVNGRNGVRVNNVLIKRGGRQQIKSGAILEIAGTQMMFVTPGDKAQIDQSFIDRAKALATGEEFPQLSNSLPEAAQNGSYSESGYTQIGSYQSLAPAPPNFKRASPPEQQQDGKGQRTVFDSKPPQSPMYNRGMMMETTQEIDYSRDTAKDLKPPYSYAMMIAQAIFSSEEEKLTLSNIYAYIADQFAFYRHSNSGWQNSIRHNLSLNKAFQKVPRRTDEPGKGMKWQIAPEYRQEYWKKQARKGATSSAPSSPASGKEVNPNFRGPNGQNLGYDITMVNQFSAKDMSDRRVPPHPAKMNFPQLNPTQPLPPPLAHMPQTSTPVRPKPESNIHQRNMEVADDSPLHSQPNFNPPYPTPSHQYPAYTLPSSVPPPHRSPSNPTLSSSYLDTPFLPHSHLGPGNNMMITPAPLRQNPKLAPPSTLVAPSKYMPDSSPGGPSLFWKGLMGQTPGMVAPDISPVKDENNENTSDGIIRGVMSSSPPPMDDSGSPSKPGRSSQAPASSMGRSTGLTSSQNGNGNAKNGGGMISVKDDDDDDAASGFDLARGFAPIAGSFSSLGSKTKA